MRFLTVSLGYHPDIIGGAWRVAAEQCTGLAARGHTVEVITAHPGGHLPATEIRQGVRIHRFPSVPGSFITRWRAANRDARDLLHRRLAASDEPTLIVQHHAFLGPATRTRAAPVLHIFHGPWAEEYRFASLSRSRSHLRRGLDRFIPLLLHRIEARTLRRARRIVVLSRHFAEGLVRWHPGTLPPIEIVPGGVDTKRFHPPTDRAALRQEWGLNPADFLCVAVRRLDPRMGLDILVEAFARVAPALPQARLWLTGRGGAELDLRRRVALHGLGDRVRFLGFLSDPDVPRLLGAADVTLMPSLDLEGFGLATAESLACGTPVLGSRAGATPELLEPLDAGLLFEPHSIDALAARLQAFVSHPERLPSRDVCSAFARERFPWASQISACERAAGDFLPLPPQA